MEIVPYTESFDWGDGNYCEDADKGGERRAKKVKMGSFV